MDHLYASVAAVTRLNTAAVDGTLTYSYEAVSSLAALRCRFDVGFLRPGRDQPMPAEAGRAPDRIGVLYCAPDTALRVGDRLTFTSGPVDGVFEIRVVPDKAADFSTAHHIECQLVEVAQQVSSSYNFDGA